MKQILLVCSIAFGMTACQQETKTSTTTTPDTTGLAAYQAFQQQRIADSIALANKTAEAAAVRTTTKSAARSGTASRSTSSASNSSNSTTMNSESSNAAQKKGWSKTAKGAVIGGVVGAGTGAIVNKKNRAAGAVVGGVVGAGAGAVIGHQKDKKDGRH